MASLHKDKRSGNWLVLFRWDGRQFCKSCDTRRRDHAIAVESRATETIRLLRQGRIEVPENADPGIWIMTDGKVNGKPQSVNGNGKPLSRLGKVCDAYLEDQLAKADTTLEAERRHIGHLKRMLGEGTAIRSLTLKDMQGYVVRRTKSKFRGKRISGKTVRKELVTFTQVWSWAKQHKYVKADCPVYKDNHKWGVTIPKPKEREKFQTWSQIERTIKRGGLSKHQVAELWATLFLDEDQVRAVLDFVQGSDTHPFIYPMFVMAAYTGARRGEIRRSEITDFNFEEGTVRIRERKRRKDMAQTFRFVPLHPRLQEVMEAWFEEHPGGQYTITAPLKMTRRKARTTLHPVTLYEAHHHFKQALKESKWKVLRGFHVLRHSFGSNLARSGEVSRDTIAEWMGHTTEEMKSLYQHLFPQDGRTKISVLK